MRSTPAHTTSSGRKHTVSMEPHRQHNGLQTFLEHWGVLLTAAIAFFAAQVLMFFTHLTGTP